MNTQENNKTIAEFMGCGKDEIENIHWIDTEDGYGFASDELQYHKSWNWLMPVVEKIESLGYEFFIVEDRVEVSHNTDHSIETIIDLTFGGSKRDATYQGVVEFINQYNKNESTN